MVMMNRAIHVYRLALLLTVSLIATSTSDARGKPNCTLFLTNYMQRCSPSTLPKEGLATRTLEVVSSLGEYEPCTFSIRANEDLSGITVEVSDLSCGRAIIPRSNVVVRKAETRDYPVPSGKVLKAECYLPRLKSVDVPKDSTQRFWLVIHTPESAAPGAYRGEVTLRCGGEAFEKLDLRLNVLPVKLLQPKDMSYFMYYGVHNMPSFTRNMDYQRRCFLDMKAHGMTTTTLYYYPTKRADGSIDLRYDRTATSLPVIPSMKQMADTGLAASGRPVIWVGAEFANTQAFEAMFAEARKRKWPELLLYLVDEPVDEARQKKLVEVMARVDELRQAHPEMRIRTVTAINAVAISQVGKYYDIWICYAPDVGEHMVKQAKQEGKELWCYDCSLASVDALTSRYCYGFWAWKCGLKGVSNWAYADVPSAYGNKRWSPSQKEQISPLSFVHPIIEEPVPSVSWEAVREGVDDYRYLTTLTALVEQAKSAGKANEAADAEKLLAEVGSLIHMDGFTKSYLAACKADTGSKEENQSYVYNRVPPEPAIPLTGYDELRHRIARQIVKLSEALR